jgi:hypothetical protein
MKKLLPLVLLVVLSLGFSSCSSEAPEGGDAAPAEEASAMHDGMSDMITISTPAAGENVSSPFNVTGQTTMTEETTLNLESYGADGVLNSEAKWHTNDDGSFDFGSTYYFIGGGGEGRVDVILLDENDAELDRASMSVVFE